MGGSFVRILVLHAEAGAEFDDVGREQGFGLQRLRVDLVLRGLQGIGHAAGLAHLVVLAHVPEGLGQGVVGLSIDPHLRTVDIVGNSAAVRRVFGRPPQHVHVPPEAGAVVVLHETGLIVVDLDMEDVPAVRGQIGLDQSQDLPEPRRRLVEVGGIGQGGSGRPLGIVVHLRGQRRVAPLQYGLPGHPVFGPEQQPVRIAAVAPFIAEEGAGAAGDLESRFGKQAQQVFQVPARIGVPVEIEHVLLRLVPVPERIKVDGVDAESLQALQLRGPAIPGQAVIEKGRRMHDEGLAVQPILRVGVDDPHLIAGRADHVPDTVLGRGQADKAQQERQETYRKMNFPHACILRKMGRNVNEQGGKEPRL